VTTPPTRIGKSTVAACVGSIIAQLCQDGWVVAIDADTSFGKLGARVDPHATVSPLVRQRLSYRPGNPL
jgi:MinD-like ATPase involved in chromosome partitioning or flagellar assembly